MNTLFIASAIVSGITMVPVCIILRKAGVVDRPNARSSHKDPTIRGAGVAIVFTILGFGIALDIGSHFVRFATVIGAFTLLAAVSFIDDLRTMRASVRFSVQAVATVAAIVSVLGGWIVCGPWTLLFVAISCVWVAGYTNGFNFMDGINGIAGMQALLTGSGTAAIAVILGLPPSHPAVALALVSAGAAFGFLPYNFPRARVFMGDVGSAPLGFLLAVVAVWIAHLTAWWVLFWIGLLHANFVLDTGVTLVRRAMRGDRLHDAHREHFYQRLVRVGWSHTSVTLTEAGLQVLVALALWQATNAAWPIKVAVGAAVIVAWLAFFGFVERVFRKSPAGVTDAEMLAARRGAQRDPDGAVR